MQKYKSVVLKIWEDIFHTIFPDLCLACSQQPKARQASFCIGCLLEMPYTDHFFQKNNDVTKHFRGRVSLHHGAALLYFREGSKVQNMLHQLKYKKRIEIGQILGELAGKKLLESTLFEKPDLIIPVPIHPKKVLKRGYNQSEVFGKAVSQVICVALMDDILLKDRWSESQTGKSRTARVANVEEVFILKRPDQIRGRHILLVDDVVTTGATIEACCNTLKEGNVGKISVLSIASAK